MKRTLLLAFALLFLFGAEILRVYFIMPFPGSQRANTVELAYFVHKYIWSFRILGWMLLFAFALNFFRHAKLWKKITLSFFIFLYAVVFYLFNFRFLADKMFYMPKNKILVTAGQNKIDSSKLIIGINLHGQARAYPIGLIAYHHQVEDTVGGENVLVTYCSVCRTGRVFSPFVNGRLQRFRLVGMDHFNAMFEDEGTRSWWRQATGVAVTGPLKGTVLKELPSQQLRLGAWIRNYPNTLVMQPDSLFTKQYKDLEGFDEGNVKSSLERRDLASWKFKSWVLGVQMGIHSRAYDWNELLKVRVINDTIAGKPVVIFLENDQVSFHVFQRAYFTGILHFEMDGSGNYMRESQSNTIWSPSGICLKGIYKDQKLLPLPAYQEFWHSWKEFHPLTTVYGGK